MDFKDCIEFFIAAIIIIAAIYIIYMKIRNSNNQCRNCGSCSKMCPHYRTKKIQKNKFKS
ncbi:FeoB-associated Cys-rich membrane protein [Clostridium thailandense]|uniref:FeoB-associated Cys-rich membrane protein n=1 Tax=Clostridium thailandense TaxID=2794346 RepID=A0A949TVY0_9CLOT|nr:FeoB-associated Cys-rich membrane protein [Clostridium thailandense]MBV7274541.1 FeoB-associated Cys-rich membrane protein [Clostridium thailandense]